MLNLEPDVYRWFRDIELRAGLSKSMLGTAAICALRALSAPGRDAMVQWAKLLEDERATWTGFEEACEQTAKEREQALNRALERALHSELEEYREPQVVRVQEVPLKVKPVRK